MAPHDLLRRPIKRSTISDQQKRRDQTLIRQVENRKEIQHQARCIRSSLESSLQNDEQKMHESVFSDPETLPEADRSEPQAATPAGNDFDVYGVSNLKGSKPQQCFFSRLFMLPEWMIDIPPQLNPDWFVFARPAGKRCFVVSYKGNTISRLRNGLVLHYQFPSALPNGSRIRNNSGPANSLSLLDCIFHEPDQTYYVIDMVFWKDYSLYECDFDLRYFWLKSKLAETGASDPPSQYHKYKFNVVPLHECDQMGLYTAYAGVVPYVKDGLLFYKKNAFYQRGNTPLALVWKDQNCSQYVIDTDGKGKIPAQQQAVLELHDDGKLKTSDDPPVVLGCLDLEFLQKSGLYSGNILRFAIGDDDMRRFVEGKTEMIDLHYLGKAPNKRPFADSYSKILFQYNVRQPPNSLHSPVTFEHLMASITPLNDRDEETKDGLQDSEMIG